MEEVAKRRSSPPARFDVDFEVFAKAVLTPAGAIAYIRLTNDGGGAEADRTGR